MNGLVIYSLQTIISAGLFILIYHLFVRNTNTYNWNRFYLLTTMILSLLLPLIDVSGWFTIEKPVILYNSMIKIDQAITVVPFHQVQNAFSVSDFIIVGYWVIVGLLLIRFVWGITSIFTMITNHNYDKKGSLKFYQIKLKTTFSFFNHIFIQPEYWDAPVNDYIIQHELAHVNNLHSLDKILTELILVFGWFNPFYYIFRRDLHLVHECQADNDVIKSGCDKLTYHQILLDQINGNFTYRLSNQFSYSLITSRFKMISNDKQSRYTRLRILLAIPTTFVLLILFSFTDLKDTASLLQNKILNPVIQSVGVIMEPTKHNRTSKPQEAQIIAEEPAPVGNKETPLLVVEQNPEFPGGYAAMQKFLHDNIEYPLTAQETGIKGTVFVQFVVSKTGKISNTKILRGIGQACDDEAIKVVNEMPRWIPGRQNGSAVPVIFQIPIKFQILMR
jgi:TonB family protein